MFKTTRIILYEVKQYDISEACMLVVSVFVVLAFQSKSSYEKVSIF